MESLGLTIGKEYEILQYCLGSCFEDNVGYLVNNDLGTKDQPMKKAYSQNKFKRYENYDPGNSQACI